MKIFISSAIAGMEEFRDAAADAVRALGYEVIRSEDFPASDSTPEQACLAGVRASDLTILLLGGRYGHVQLTGRSATHDEFLEAKQFSRPLVFVQEGIERDELQATFVQEARDWAGGVYTASFTSADELRQLVIKHVHQLLLVGVTAPEDGMEIHDRAVAAAGSVTAHRGGSARIIVVVASGPLGRVIPPSDFSEDLAARIHKEAVFGASPVLERSVATETQLVESGLVLRQERAEVSIDAGGTVVIQAATGGRASTFTSMPGLDALIEERVRETLIGAIRFAGNLLEMIDRLRRVPDSALVAGLVGGRYLAWRTEAEQRVNPNSIQLNHQVRDVDLVPSSPYVVRRGDLLGSDAAQIADDLVALLRGRFLR